MTPDNSPDLDPQVERWLRDSRPQSDSDFVTTLEGRLFSPPRPKRFGGRRPFLIGVGAAFATAAAALVLALAGTGPFGGGNDNVRAGDNCRFVTVNRIESVPTLVTGRDGEPTIKFQKQRVHRRVRQCR